MQLRPRQEEALEAILQNYIEGVTRQLVVKATGTGKAVVIANIQKKVGHLLPGKVLVFAHTEELVDQLVTTYQAWNPDKKVGKEQASFYADTDCDIIVSCVASIGRFGSQRLARFGSFDIIICDEAHHSIAQTYLNVFEATGVLPPTRKTLLVGFTATPKRKNRVKKSEDDTDEILSLSTVYEKIVYTYPIRKAIKEGWLVPLRGYRIKTNVSLDAVKMQAGDFQQAALAEAVNLQQRNLEILEAWKEHGEGRQTVGFSVDVQHAQDLAELFQNNGIKAEAIWGAAPDRADTLERHKNRKTTVLFNAQVLTEGYDDWQVSCIILAAPTRNSSLYTQRIGRGTRLQQGVGNLVEALSKGLTVEKSDCIILDMVDSSKKCSLVTLPSLVGLNPEFDLHGESVTQVAEQMEELQDKFPMVDLGNLTDISRAKVYLESIDLFAEPYTVEVKEFSKLTWVTGAGGGYLLAIPEQKELKGQYTQYKHEKLHIEQNELDEWKVSITSAKDPEKELGTYKTLKEAFEEADDAVRRCRPDRMKLLGREEQWRGQIASEAVKSYLRRLTKKKPLLKCICTGYHNPEKQCTTCKQMPITAGEAATAIEILKARK